MNTTAMVTRDLSILIADDSPPVVAELTTLLEAIPGTCLVGTAANAAQTIQAVLDLDPDVLILDMRMPDGSGLDVLRALLSLGRRTVTLMLTNHTDAVTRERALRAGAVAFYDKSREIPELIADIEERASSPRTPPPAGGQESEHHILVVEDDPAVRSLIRRFLEKNAFVVTDAADALEALAILDAASPPPIDLLLTDLEMHGMSGADLARRVRELLPETRTLFMSGHPLDLVMEQHGGFAEARFIAKPFGMEELLERIREAIDPSRR